MNNAQKPVMLPIHEKVVESPVFATLYFKASIDFKPGQFLMAWIPGLDEKPYTVSFHDDQTFGITIEAKGIFSRKAVTLKKGDLMGFRGPFGNGFSIKNGQRAAVVAGGCGMAPLAPLVERLGSDTIFIQGAKSKSFILYPDRFDPAPDICTDDGSMGQKALVTDLLEQAFARTTSPDIVYACGPEIMMHKVYSLCEKAGINCQVSLERYMRCGFGICGACVCDDRIVCKDGPVFNSKQLSKMKDFNTTALLKNGRPVALNEFFSWRCQ